MDHPIKSRAGRYLLSASVFSLVALPLSFAFWQIPDGRAIAVAEPHPWVALTASVEIDPVEIELVQIVHKQSEAWNNGDIREFMSAYWNDERLTFSSSGKTQRGWKATYENYKKNYPDQETMGKLTFTELETQELSPTARLMLGTWQLERAAPVGGNFSLVWKRIDGKWLIVHDHSSALK
jgi:ketosteroid isomerase-like protein